MSDAKIKTSTATFNVNGTMAIDNNNVTIGSDGRVITAAKYQIESATGNLTANEGAYFFNSDENKTFTVNGVTYTTDEILGVIATTDSSKIYGTGDNDGVTETLKVTIDDGKNLTADDKSTLHGGKFILGNNVTVTIDGNKTVKLTSAESVNLTYENDVIKDFTIDNGTLEVIGTDNDDNINVDGKINIDSGNGADKITVAGGATVKADSDDTITVTKNNSAVIEFNEKSATITALDVDSKLTFEESGLVIAENWKGNVDGNITLSLPAGTYLHCR